MSQTTLEIVDIPIDQIRPSPFQPRLVFDLEELRGSIIQYGIRDPLKVRKVDDYYEIIDGERRWRIAEQERMKTVPCLVLEYTDEEADALSWRFNTERKDYSVEEKSKHFHKHQLEGMSARSIARIHGYSHQTVASYLSIFRLPENFQNYVWAGEFSFQKFEYLYEKGLLNGNAVTPPTHAITLIQQSIDQDLKQKEFERVVDDLILDLKEKQVETAKKVAATIDVSQRRVEIAKEEIGELEVKEPETPEEFEEAAEVLRREAKRRKTPKQIREEKQKKTKDALSGKNSVATKIEHARELGIDTKWMEEEKEKIENKMPFQPDDALLDAKALKNQINEMISNFQQKQKEAEIEQKVEKEFKDKKKEEIKDELRKDEAFKAELRTELMKEMTTPSRVETLPVEIPEEEAKVLRERIEEQRQKMAEWMNDPEIQKRGALFKNWVAHGAMLDVISSVFCPNDPEKSTWKDLRWSCCGLSVEEAYDMLLKKLEKGR
jgi:ParB family chromosome partitioning protein